jgi:hypothetical protein
MILAPQPLCQMTVVLQTKTSSFLLPAQERPVPKFRTQTPLSLVALVAFDAQLPGLERLPPAVARLRFQPGILADGRRSPPC